MSATPPETAAFTGTTRFQVLGPLGVGAMCVVHRARDLELGDVVALKTLKHLDHDSLYRLKQEFRALSAFDHPNLVSFYELLHSPDGWFVTMELIEGVDYLSWCRGRSDGDLSRARTMSTWRSATDLRFGRSAPGGGALHDDNAITEPLEAIPELRLPDLLKLRSSLRQLADGVSALHAGGRIHRDLKPSNVLVSEAGRVVILDFGLVADINQDYTEGTLHQSIAGSAAYMSPEQAVGTTLTEASDWYAVGVMLYEALTGRWPFSGSLYQILTLKNALDPEPPSTLLPDVPKDLDELCMALLQRDPDARPSGGEVLATLRNQDAGHAVPKLLVPFRYRDRELGVLRAARDHARNRGGACVVVRGPRGSGRTQLVREFVKELNQGRGGSAEAVTLKGRCFEWERMPYKAIDALIDNLARVLRRAPIDQIQALAREDLSWLAALFPVVSRADALDIMPANPGDTPPEVVADKAFEQLGRVLDVLGEAEPVLAFIDDVHWGDAESGRVLAGLLAKPKRHLLLVVTEETGASSPLLSRLLPDLERRGVATGAIELGALRLDQSAELASAMLGVPASDPIVAELANKSQGLPGTLRELVRQRVTASTQDEAQLDEVRANDIAGLPLIPRRLLELLAIAHGPVPTEVAVLAAQLGEQAVNAVSTLRAHRLADVSGPSADALEIGSRSVMDHVEDATPDTVRVQHHLALATALEQAGSTDTVALATHYAAGGDRERAGTLAWLAANRALEGGDWNGGALLLELALEHGEWQARERVSMVATLGRTLGLLGRPRAAIKALTEAIGGAPDASRNELRRHRVEQILAAGDLAPGLQELQALMAASGLPAFPKGLLAGGVSAWRRFQQRRRGQNFETRLRTDVDEAELLKVDVAWTCVGPLGQLDPQRANDYQSVHLTTALDVGEVERVMRALTEDVVIQQAKAMAADHAALERVRELATTHRSNVALARLAGAEARIAWMSGQVERTADLAPEAEVKMRRSALPAWERQQQRTLAIASRAALARIDELGPQLDGIQREALLRGDERVYFELWGTSGAALSAARGRADADRADLRQRLVLSPVGGRSLAWGALAVMDLDLATDHIADAQALGAEHEALFTAMSPDPWLRTRHLRVRALIARATGDTRELARCTASLRQDDRPWATAWADLVDGRYDAAAHRLHDLGFGLEAAVAGSHIDQTNADWLEARGVTHLDALQRIIG